MNKTETKAYDWLLKQGIPKDAIVFQRNKSPDFIFTDRNVGYEIKRLYGKKILIDPRQFELMKQQKRTITILVFSDQQDKPVATIPLREINEETARYADMLIQWYSYNVGATTIRVKKTTMKRFDVFGNKGETDDQLLNRLLDEIVQCRARGAEK